MFMSEFLRWSIHSKNLSHQQNSWSRNNLNEKICWEKWFNEEHIIPLAMDDGSCTLRYID